MRSELNPHALIRPPFAVGSDLLLSLPDRVAGLMKASSGGAPSSCRTVNYI